MDGNTERGTGLHPRAKPAYAVLTRMKNRVKLPTFMALLFAVPLYLTGFAELTAQNRHLALGFLGLVFYFMCRLLSADRQRLARHPAVAQASFRRRPHGPASAQARTA